MIIKKKDRLEIDEQLDVRGHYYFFTRDTIYNEAYFDGTRVFFFQNTLDQSLEYRIKLDSIFFYSSDTLISSRLLLKTDDGFLTKSKTSELNYVRVPDSLIYVKNWDHVFSKIELSYDSAYVAYRSRYEIVTEFYDEQIKRK